MNKFINRLMVLLFSSMVFGMSVFAYDPNAFIFVVQTDNPGTSADNQFTIPTNSSYSYYYDVDCGNDGIYDALGVRGNYTCSFPADNNSTAKAIAITATFPNFYLNNEGDKEKLLYVEQWGTQPWESMENMFEGASNLEYVGTVPPDLSHVASLSYMFSGCTSLNTSAIIGNWNVSHVTNMRSMFSGATSFNQYIGDWDVSQVTTLRDMFNNATSFNQNIGDWNVSQVTSMGYMFKDATSFNQNIGNWNVSNVRYMHAMFSDATSFNQDIGDWNVSQVTDMGYMFESATNFNQDIGNWNVSNVSNIFSMDSMFRHATNFNRDIGDWNVSQVTNMEYMFEDATNFNQDIGNWNVSQVTLIAYMFKNATNFNQDIGDWDVSHLTDMHNMFQHATKFNQDIGDWDVSHVTNMNFMLQSTSFSQDLGDWNISNVTSMINAFSSTKLSINDYDNMLISWNKILLKENVTLGMGDRQYCLGEDARTHIIADYSWTIWDDGILCDFYISSPYYITVESGQSEVGTITIHGDPSDIVYGYLLNGDGTKFAMGGLSGKLSFITPPDVSHPTDKNRDNIYKVRVLTFNTDTSEVTATQTIRVKVVAKKNSALVPIISYLLF